MRVYRQGDVLIREACIPLGAIEQPKTAGRVVLARGEVTGHAHVIESRFARLLAHGAEQYLRATRVVSLRHEEHGEIRLPRGMYKITIQREYAPEEIRNVAD